MRNNNLRLNLKKHFVRDFLLILIVFVAIVFIAFVLISCKPTTTKKTFKVVGIKFESEIDPDMIQNGVNGGNLYVGKTNEDIPETLKMHIELDNASSAPIDYVVINGEKYFDKDSNNQNLGLERSFTADSYYRYITVKLSKITKGTKVINLDSIAYRLPNERVEYKGTALKMNVKYDVEFVVTFNLTEINRTKFDIDLAKDEHDEEGNLLSQTTKDGLVIEYDRTGDIIKRTKTARLNYLSIFKLPLNNLELSLSELHPTGYCPAGKGFMGWYTVEETPKLVNPHETIYYAYTTDIEIKPRFLDRFVYEEVEINISNPDDPSGNSKIPISGLSVKDTNITPVMYKNVPVIKNELDKEYIPDFYEGKPIIAISKEAFLKHQKGGFEIHLGKNIKVIGEKAFYKVKSLKIDLNEIEEIQNSAFEGCGFIEFINRDFPVTLKRINDRAFWGSTPKEYLIKNQVENSSMNVSLTNTIFIPETIKYIGERAFERSEVERVFFELGVELDISNFKNNAFANCKSLRTVSTNIERPKEPENNLKINATEECKIKTIPQEAFLNCEAIVNESSNITTLAHNGVYGHFYLGEGIEEISNRAFASCSNSRFKNLYLPKSLKHLRSEAFSHVPLTIIEFNDNSEFKIVEDYVFNNSKVEEITFKNLEGFGENVFYNNPFLDAITIENTSEAFAFGVQKTSTQKPGFANERFKIFVSDGILQAFRDKNNENDIKSRILSNKYIHTGNQDSKYYKIAYEHIDDSDLNVRITNVWGQIPSNFTIPEKIPYFDNNIKKDKIVIELGSSCLMKSINSVIIPKGVEKIGNSAFHNNKTLQSVNIFEESNSESMLKEIGSNAFAGTAITKFYSNPTLNKIGNQCFVRCEKLSEVYLYKGANLEVGRSAFILSGITKVYIGNNDVISALQPSAFSNCSNLKEAYIEFTETDRIKTETFGTDIGGFTFVRAHPDFFVCFSSSATAESMMDKHEEFRKYTIYSTNWNENGMPNEDTKELVFPLEN